MKADKLEAFFATVEPAGLGPERRAGVLPAREVLASLDAVGVGRGVQGKAGECFRALVLVWHDHLDAAHGLVQDLSGADAAWVHGIVHRREPDYSNARYWFHRVGQHEVLEPLAEAVAPMLAEHAALPYRLIRDGRWEPFAFIDAVLGALREPRDPEMVQLIRSLQAVEIRVLARYLAGV